MNQQRLVIRKPSVNSTGEGSQINVESAISINFYNTAVAMVGLFAWIDTTFTVYKWNESGFRPPLCTYRLNWARRTSWGWWDEWDDTVLQTQDSKFEPWRSEAEHATSRSRRFPTILTFTRGWGRNIFVSLKPPRPGTEPRTLAWKAAVLTTTLGPPPSLCLDESIACRGVHYCMSLSVVDDTI